MELQRLLKDNGGLDDFKVPFRKLLHAAPYGLKYSLDANHPDLFLVHGTDKSDLSIRSVREANGIIFEKASLKCIAYGMNKIEEFPRPPLVTPPVHEVQESEDGTVVKIFFYQDSWMSSTNKRIDAKRSTWSSARCFHELLLDALPGRDWDAATGSLNPEMVYSFVLLHPENYIVTFHPAPVILHVATRRTDTSEEVQETVPWAQKPRMTDNLESASPLARGIILVDKSDMVDVRRMKLDRPFYRVAQDLRKNMKHMHLSYLACHGEERANFSQVFPGFAPFTVGIDYWLSVLLDDVHREYMKSFVRKQYLFEKDHPYFPLVIGCHKRYKASGNKVTKAICQDIIDETSAVDVDAAIRFCSQKYVQPQKKM